jgi:hypothetical protein
MMIDADYGVSNYGPKSPIDNMLQVIQSALKASGEITQAIFDDIRKADKEIEDFTKKLDANKIPKTVSAIVNQQNKAEQLLAVLNLPASKLDPSALQAERGKLVAIMGQLDELKQEALAQARGASAGPSIGPGIIA